MNWSASEFFRLGDGLSGLSAVKPAVVTIRGSSPCFICPSAAANRRTAPSVLLGSVILMSPKARAIMTVSMVFLNVFRVLDVFQVGVSGFHYYTIDVR